MKKLISGTIVPYMNENGGRRWHYEWSLDELEKCYSEFIKLLKELMRDLKNVLPYLKVDLHVKLRLINDVIVTLFEAPLRTLVVPPSVKGDVQILPIPSPDQIYWLWLLTRYLEHYSDEEIASIFKTLWNEIKVVDYCFKKTKESEVGFEDVEEVLFRRVPGLGSILEKTLVASDDIRELVRRIFFTVPSDTRPGLNSSKLIPHLLTTSACAVSFYISRLGKPSNDSEMLEYEILRTASLLHDIGKPIAWIEQLRTCKEVPHAPKSVKIVKELFTELLPDSLINLITELIRHHHKRDLSVIEERVSIEVDGKVLTIRLRELLELLRLADSISSSIDRLDKIAFSHVSKAIGISKDEWNSAEAMKKLPDETIISLTERICRELFSKGVIIEEVERETKKQHGKPYIYLSGFDVRRIQQFVLRERLRLLVAGSYLVDLVTVYLIPRVIIDVLYLPPESIIYAGGGFGTFISPYNVKNFAEKLIRRFIGLLGISDIDVVFESAELHDNLQHTSSELIAKIGSTKALFNFNSNVIELGIERPCDLCGKGFAVKKEDYFGESLLLCDTCAKMSRMANSLYFRAKLEYLRKLGYPLVRSINDIIRYIMEWLSGSETGEGYAISMIKIDGNAMGAFMSTCVSLTDMKERSLRIDYSLKKGIMLLFKYLLDKSGLRQKSALKTIARLYTGLIYVGGDDLLAIWPAFIALPATLLLAYEFWLEMGGSRQLSISIIGSKARHNIWALRELSEEMLNWCKAFLREKLLEIPNANPWEIISSDIIGVISFFYEEVQPLPVHAEVLKSYSLSDAKMSQLVISRQPLILYRPDVDENINEKLKFHDVSRLISLILTDKNKKEMKTVSLSSLRKMLENFLKFSCTTFTGNDKKAKELRNLVREVYEVGKSIAREKDPLFFTKIISAYLMRQKIRKEKLSEDSTLYWNLIKFLRDEKFEVPPPLLDLFYIAKFSLGGR